MLTVRSSYNITLLNNRRQKMTMLTAAQMHSILNHPTFLGFDSMFERLNQTFDHQPSTYPPHNVLKNGEDEVVVELALAGYAADDISIQVKEEQLIIIGEKPNNKNEYLHHGISAKKFKKQFTLGEYMVVQNASFENGLLKVYIERIIPDEKKPRTIEINGKKREKKSLLKG